jgi:hypothetical protein
MENVFCRASARVPSKSYRVAKIILKNRHLIPPERSTARLGFGETAFVWIVSLALSVSGFGRGEGRLAAGDSADRATRDGVSSKLACLAGLWPFACPGPGGANPCSCSACCIRVHACTKGPVHDAMPAKRQVPLLAHVSSRCGWMMPWRTTVRALPCAAGRKAKPDKCLTKIHDPPAATSMDCWHNVGGRETAPSRTWASFVKVLSLPPPSSPAAPGTLPPWLLRVKSTQEGIYD